MGALAAPAVELDAAVDETGEQAPADAAAVIGRGGRQDG